METNEIVSMAATYEQVIIKLKGLLYLAIDELEETGMNDELLNKLEQGLCKADAELLGE